jgi:hypothetical protein
MKKNLPLFGICILFFLASCSSDVSDKTKTDSVQNYTSASATILSTDSGKLEIKRIGALKESEATLFSSDGKISQKGKFFENKPAGAWLKYDASGKVISAYHYSNGKPMHKLDPEDFNFVTCAKPGFGATFSVPKAWPETPSPDPSQLVAFSKNVADPTVTLHPNFNFRHEKLHPGDSLEQLANMQLQVLHENVGRLDLVEKNEFSVDGCAATRCYGMFSEESGTVGFLSAVIISGDDVWFFSCEAQNNKAGEFLIYQGVFQEILESFKRVK